MLLLLLLLLFLFLLVLDIMFIEFGDALNESATSLTLEQKLLSEATRFRLGMLSVVGRVVSSASS